MSIRGRLNKVQRESDEFMASKQRKLQSARYLVRLGNLREKNLPMKEWGIEFEEIINGLLRLSRESRERKGL